VIYNVKAQSLDFDVTLPPIWPAETFYRIPRLSPYESIFIDITRSTRIYIRDYLSQTSTRAGNRSWGQI